ncbi:MAG: sulfatase [Lacipirellulaceae bacterium]
MIWVDDLRPEIAAYGVEAMHTPGLDRLAERSVRFDRAYCNISVCGASRASVMTGLRCTPTRFIDYDTWAERDAPEAVTLNEHFLKNGYHTAFYGKVFHFPEDSANGWTEGKSFYEWPGYTEPESKAIYEVRQASGDWKNNGPAWELANVADNELADGKIAEAACQSIERLSKGSKPFFLATGFFKPHLPFVAPEEYWQHYQARDMRLPDNFIRTCDAPEFAFSNWGELRSYAGMPETGSVSPEVAKQLIAAYRACVSFTDAQIAKLLDTLEASGEAENTIIVLLGDHGWNLGEHGMWCKHCCFETSMRTPLMISAPTLAGFKPGQATQSITEFTDIFPTLCELSGLDTPTELVGQSAVGLLKDTSKSHREAAIGRFKIGDTIRTNRYRYTLFRDDNGKGQVIGEMLFDQQEDPAENNNLAKEPNMKQVISDLRTQLEASFSKANVAKNAP